MSIKLTEVRHMKMYIRPKVIRKVASNNQKKMIFKFVVFKDLEKASIKGSPSQF